MSPDTIHNNMNIFQMEFRKKVKDLLIRMRRRIWIFVWGICPKVRFLKLRPKWAATQKTGPYENITSDAQISMCIMQSEQGSRNSY